MIMYFFLCPCFLKQLQGVVLFYFFIIIYFKNFWLHWVFVAARGLSSGCSERGLLFIVVRGLLIAVASPVAEQGL